MSLTFNSNNNYSVEIITEADLSNPSTIEYSVTTNTPFVTMKIIPTNPQTQPVLASNIKIDDIIPDFNWNAGVNYNTNGICEPPPPPHSANSSLQHTTGIGVTSNCQTLGFNSFFGTSSLPQQGPYSAQNDFAVQANQIANSGVSWSEIILIEVYEDDNGNLINDNFSPVIAENYNEWAMWPATPAITANIYPVYVKAFVYLSFGSGGMTGLTSNTTLNLDIDEVEPTLGCTDPLANNYDATATVDDGSCILPPTSKTIYIQESEIVHSTSFTGYTDPPFPSQVPSFDSAGNIGTMDLSAQPFMPKNLKVANQIPLSTTYMPGDSVYETVLVNIVPRSKDNIIYGFSGITIETGIATFDFTIAGGPDNQDTTTPESFLGDAANNLTAASIYINNNDPDNSSIIGRGDYVAYNTSGSFSSNISAQPNWMPDSGFLDVDGLFPRTIVEWPNANEISFEQPDGSFFTAELDGIWAEEIYTLNPLVPGQEWFPMRIEFYIIVEFIMPNHDVYLNLDLIHDTQRLLQN